MRLAVSTLHRFLKHGHGWCEKKMAGVYAFLFEAVCDVTTVPSHLSGSAATAQQLEAAAAALQLRFVDISRTLLHLVSSLMTQQKNVFIKSYKKF